MAAPNAPSFRVDLPADRSPMPEFIPQYKEFSSKLQTLPTRDEQNSLIESVIINENQTDVSQHFRILIIHFEMRERIHIYFVKESFRALGLETDHDWSKDHYYMYVLLGRFGLGIPNTDQSFNQLFIDEVNRHYELEPHHPEYEKYNDGKECSDDDVMEMAIDRLTRNIVAANGAMDYDTMRKYGPSFFLGDTENKLHKYWEYVEKHKQTVLDVYHSKIAAALAEKGEW